MELDQTTNLLAKIGNSDAPVAEPICKQKPFEVIAPKDQTIPLVFASPHSGRAYPADFVEASRLTPIMLRRSEDSFVDELFSEAPTFGAPLLKANFPRAYVDPNREAYELDPTMFEDQLPDFVNTNSIKVSAGLGTVAKVVTNGEEIYKEKLQFAEIKSRVESSYFPYHAALRKLINATRARFGICIFIDPLSLFISIHTCCG